MKKLAEMEFLCLMCFTCKLTAVNAANNTSMKVAKVDKAKIVARWVGKPRSWSWPVSVKWLIKYRSRFSWLYYDLWLWFHKIHTHTKTHCLNIIAIQLQLLCRADDMGFGTINYPNVHQGNGLINNKEKYSNIDRFVFVIG